MKETEKLLDEQVWQKWVQKNKAHDFVLAQRVRAILTIMVVGLFIGFMVVWRLTR